MPAAASKTKKTTTRKTTASKTKKPTTRKTTNKTTKKTCPRCKHVKCICKK